MASAKDIIIKPISSKDAREIIRELHYSGKVVNNSQIHFGVFLDGQCGGALQFGPSIDKRKILPLVKYTGWNEYTELNRMALADWLPRNGESRSIAIAMRLLRKYYPHIKWVLSFADGTQCGDGTIYRAAGFILTGIKENDSLYKMPNGGVLHEWQLRVNDTSIKKEALMLSNGGASLKGLLSSNTDIKLLEGYQLRYIYFLDPTWRSRLTVPEIPYSRIDELGIGMYKGKKRPPKQTGNDNQSITGGAEPTRPLQSEVI